LRVYVAQIHVDLSSRFFEVLEASMIWKYPGFGGVEELEMSRIWRQRGFEGGEDLKAARICRHQGCGEGIKARI